MNTFLGKRNTRKFHPASKLETKNPNFKHIEYEPFSSLIFMVLAIKTILRATRMKIYRRRNDSILSVLLYNLS